MFRTLLVRLIVPLVCICYGNSVWADESRYDQLGVFAGSYLCTAKATGGIIYREGSDSWEGTSFFSETQYLLRLESTETIKGQDSEHPGLIYRVSIAEHGSNIGLDSSISRCKTNAGSPDITISKRGGFLCRRSLTTFHINLEDNRYLVVYPSGYVYFNEESRNPDTPYIQAGICSKL